MEEKPRWRPDAPPETLDDDRLDPWLGVVMSRHLVAIAPDASVTTALHLMVGRNVRHLPVVVPAPGGGRCTGMAGEPDLLRGIAAERSPLGRATIRVRDVAGRALVLPERTRLSVATGRMAAENLDAVLVGTPDHLCGIVTSSDMIRIWSRRHVPTASPDTPGFGS